ncbi:hypothetical protein [Halorarius litoreus]|uniref:hypothetical protein n=1 Tax=Halorarius litoreus TaxID=2962676 RepID=UPI0020CE0774|nr:hypothetical protein [Halorarius litoreus]
MESDVKSRLNSKEWTTIRDFVDDEDGFRLPRYEAKYVEQPGMEYVENDLVLVKQVSSISGAEQIYHLPKGVFEGVVDSLT